MSQKTRKCYEDDSTDVLVHESFLQKKSKPCNHKRMPIRRRWTKRFFQLWKVGNGRKYELRYYANVSNQHSESIPVDHRATIILQCTDKVWIPTPRPGHHSGCIFGYTFSGGTDSNGLSKSTGGSIKRSLRKFGSMVAEREDQSDLTYHFMAKNAKSCLMWHRVLKEALEQINSDDHSDSSSSDEDSVDLETEIKESQINSKSLFLHQPQKKKGSEILFVDTNAKDRTEDVNQSIFVENKLGDGQPSSGRHPLKNLRQLETESDDNTFDEALSISVDEEMMSPIRSHIRYSKKLQQHSTEPSEPASSTFTPTNSSQWTKTTAAPAIQKALLKLDKLFLSKEGNIALADEVALVQKKYPSLSLDHAQILAKKIIRRAVVRRAQKKFARQQGSQSGLSDSISSFVDNRLDKKSPLQRFVSPKSGLRSHLAQMRNLRDENVPSFFSPSSDSNPNKTEGEEDASESYDTDIADENETIRIPFRVQNRHEDYHNRGLKEPSNVPKSKGFWMPIRSNSQDEEWQWNQCDYVISNGIEGWYSEDESVQILDVVSP